LLAHYESSPGKVRHFCSRCGSQLVAEKVGVPYMVLRLATLDDDPGVRPSAHIWTSHEVPWLSYGEDLPRCEEWPPGYPG
jgi:ADP-ribosyl-[dinitrogen reductase] hydrolase